MEHPADRVCAFTPGFVHEMGIAFGHLQGSVPKPVGYGELPLAALGKPGGVGVAQGMKDHALTAVSDAVIQASGLQCLCLAQGTFGMGFPVAVPKTRSAPGLCGHCLSASATSLVITARRA